MQITFEALSQALAPLESLGYEETTFEVNGLPITLRALTPEQETEVHRYTREALADGEDASAVSGLEYLERFRIGVLSFAICAVGSQDLRNVQFVETGETLANGAAVKIPTHMALRKILQGWGGSVQMGLFRKYGEIVERLERKAEAAFQFEPSDTDAEIERLERRIAALKASKEAPTSLVTPTSAMAQALIADERAQQDAVDDSLGRLTATPVQKPKVSPADAAPPATPKPSTETAPSRKPVLPTAAVPPPPSVTPRAQSVADRPGEEYEDSFVNLQDSDAVADAVARENARVLATQRASGRHLPPPPSALNAVRRPPHVAAWEAAEEAAVQLHPPEELHSRQPTEEAQRPPAFDQNNAERAAVNPRFRPRTPLPRG